VSRSAFADQSPASAQPCTSRPASSFQHLRTCLPDSEYKAKIGHAVVRMALRTCTVSFKDSRGIRHAVDVEAESLFEAVVVAVRRLRQDPFTERIGSATVLDVEARDPSTTRHAISLQQVERWLDGATSSPNEASKKAKLKVMLLQG